MKRQRLRGFPAVEIVAAIFAGLVHFPVRHCHNSTIPGAMFWGFRPWMFGTPARLFHLRSLRRMAKNQEPRPRKNQTKLIPTPRVLRVQISGLGWAFQWNLTSFQALPCEWVACSARIGAASSHAVVLRGVQLAGTPSGCPGRCARRLRHPSSRLRCSKRVGRDGGAW